MLEYDYPPESIYLAGQRAPAGRYVRVDVGLPRILELTVAGLLPASHDGHVAVYRRLPANLPFHGSPFAANVARTP